LIYLRVWLNDVALSFICTDPQYQRQGAGTLLVKWGITQARNKKVKVYLESTIDAKSMYEKLEFRAVEGISMALPGDGVYEEVCMVHAGDLA
jgi:predicted N-acetyltransferase YhbS